MTVRTAWEHLSLFESYDYVSTWYDSRHFRSPSAGKIADIIAATQQGREYFRSAADAAPAVRPLLLYYGCLSLARAATLLCSRDVSTSALQPGHGLQTIDWQGVLAEGPKDVLSLPVSCCRGSFPDFVRAVGNSHYTTFWMNSARGNKGYYLAQFETPRFLSDSTHLKLGDLLSRDLRLLDLWQKTTGTVGKVHVGHVVNVKDGFDVYVAPFGGKDLTEVEIRDLFGVPTGTVLTPTKDPRANVNCHMYRIEGDDQAARASLPLTFDNEGHFNYLVGNFPNGDRMSELIQTYLQAYILGMLARYYPSSWMLLLHGLKGGGAQPLLLASMNHVASEFPALIKDALI